MKGVRALGEALAQYLRERGVEARTAWEGGARPALDKPAAVVSLRGCRVSPGGFQDYLGERYREDTGLWEEMYGRQASVTFGLDLYAPQGAEDGAVQQVLDDLTDALLTGGPEGLAVEELTWGELAYDGQARLLKRTGQAVCLAWLQAAAQPGGLFTDFELRGGVNV